VSQGYLYITLLSPSALPSTLTTTGSSSAAAGPESFSPPVIRRLCRAADYQRRGYAESGEL